VGKVIVPWRKARFLFAPLQNYSSSSSAMFKPPEIFMIKEIMRMAIAI